MTRYLVTGAAGNLARLLVERLQAAGKEVTGLDREPAAVAGVRFEHADVTDGARLAALIDEVRPECILHMASLLTLSSEADPATAWRVNATASIELLRAAAARGVSRFFFPSTIATYGVGRPGASATCPADAVGEGGDGPRPEPQATVSGRYAGDLPDPLPEDYPQWPATIYGVTKVAVERMGAYLWRTAGLDFRAVRLPVVVSPYAPPDAVSAYPSHGFAAARRAEPFVYPAPPDLRVSSIYVMDVIEGILRLVDADPARLSRRVYNLHAFAPSTQDIAGAVSRLVPGFRYRFEPRDDVIAMLGALPSVLVDAGARRDWGWNPRFDLAAAAGDMARLLNR